MNDQNKLIYAISIYMWINGAYMVGMIFVSGWFMVLLPLIAGLCAYIFVLSDRISDKEYR